MAKCGCAGEAHALTGDGIGNVDQLCVTGDNGFERGSEESEVGAAKDDLIGACVEGRRKMAADGFNKSGVIELQGLDPGGPTGAGQNFDLNRRCVQPDEAKEPFAARRCGCCQHRDAAALRGDGGGFDARLDTDNRDVRQGLAQRVNSGRRSSIASDNNYRATLIAQMTADSQHAAADEGIILVTVGNVRRIGEINEVGMR